MPPRREHSVMVSLPELHSPRDAGEVSAAI
jgi:hypothetical protein